MLTQIDIENRIKAIKPMLTQKFKVRKIGYFGSYVDGTATESSDIDILVDFKAPLGWEFFDLQDLLENELNLKVDLLSTKAIKEQLKNQILSQVRFI
jgi:predicted nucleotidyltransferase